MGYMTSRDFLNWEEVVTKTQPVCPGYTEYPRTPGVEPYSYLDNNMPRFIREDATLRVKAHQQGALIPGPTPKKSKED